MARLKFVKTDRLDDVDLRILHAIIVAPRAPFRTIADVIGVSDQTVARRYRRLAETADLCVHGVINGQRAGWVDWLIRIQAAPGSAQRIADTLARRTDMRWVRLFSGGTEITCVLHARSPEQRNTLFLQVLPDSRHVTGITPHSILHVFTRVECYGQASSLSDAEVTRLRAIVPAPGLTTMLRDDDRPLLA